MPLTLGTILQDDGLDPNDVLVIRHAYDAEPAGSVFLGIHADSTDEEIFAYTARQSALPKIFPVSPPRFWVVLLPESGGRARLWQVLENRGEQSNDGAVRTFELMTTDHMEGLRDRLVLNWRAPRSWWLYGRTGSAYAVAEIADSQPVRFPGFDRLILDYAQLQAVIRERRYDGWRTALAAIVGIYLITDTRDGRHYVGKADGAENILQRWSTYAANGHGGNVGLLDRDASSFRYSLLRGFDPSTPLREINAAESHFKVALDSRTHGLNRG